MKQMTRVCPHQRARRIDNVLRRLLHNPARLFRPFVKPGMTVMDIGCGAGFASIGLARMVGSQGLVIAVDVQREMLDIVERRARRAGVAGRIRTHRCQAGDLGVTDAVDFAVAFWMVHEVPDTREFLRQMCACLRPEAALLVIEPQFHVSARTFDEMLSAAAEAGLVVRSGPWPRILLSRSVVLARRPSEP